MKLIKLLGIGLFLFCMQFANATNGEALLIMPTGPALRIVNPDNAKYKFNFLTETGARGATQYFLNRAIFGGYVSPENMDKSVKLLGKNGNAAGVHSEFGFYFRDVFVKYKKDSNSTLKYPIKRFGLGLEQKSFMGSSFSGDFFRLIFQGNAHFLGKNLEIKNAKIKYLQYRTLDFYWNKDLIKYKYQTVLFIEKISLVQGIGYAKLNMRNSNVFTHNWGDTVSGKMDATLQQKFGNFWKGTGLGLASSFRVNITRKAIVLFVTDFGFLYQANVTTYTKKNNFLLHQYYVTRNDFIGNFFTQHLKDSVTQSLSLDTGKINKIRMLPLQLQVSKYFSYGRYISLQYLSLPGYLPKLSYYFKSIWSKRINVFPNISLGGWDNVDLNLKLQYEIRRRNRISITFNGLESYVLPKITHGAGIFFQLFMQY